MSPDAPREQEQSIKAQKRELFEEKRTLAGPRKRFAEYLGTTNPTPLSPGLKATLWALLAVVVLLFLATIATSPGPRGTSRAVPKPNAQLPAGH